MKTKKIMIIIFMCIIVLCSCIVIASVKNNSIVLTEEEALDKLLEVDLGLNESIQDFSILGKEFNDMVKINGKDCYRFAFMEKNESGHISYIFAVSTDGEDMYRYDVVNNVYTKVRK